MLDIEGILRNPGPWLMIFLIILVFWLVRLITDQRKEVNVVKEEAMHHVSPAFMSRFTELNNIRQLKRIRDAYRRAASKGGSGRFDLEIDKEIKQLKSSSRNPAAVNPEDADDDIDMGNESDHEQAPDPIDG